MLLQKVEIEDLYGTINILIFDRAFELYNNMIFEDNIVFIEGRLSIRDDEPTKVVVNYIRELDDVQTETSITQKKSYNKVIVEISNFDEIKKEKLRGFIKFFAGNSSNIKFFVQEQDKQLSCGTIYLNNRILEELYILAGKENVILE